jgi:hypothetical protein
MIIFPKCWAAMAAEIGEFNLQLEQGIAIVPLSLKASCYLFTSSPLHLFTSSPLRALVLAQRRRFADRQQRSARFFPLAYDKTQIHRDRRSLAFFRFRNKPSAEIHRHCMRFGIHRNRSLPLLLYALLYESVNSSRASPADLVDPQRLPLPLSQLGLGDRYLPSRLAGLRALNHP